MRKGFTSILLALILLGVGQKNVFAQTNQQSQSSLYVPLIGITSVPEPLALPNGEGDVTYNYAVKNFLQELPLANIQVTDNKCSPVKFLTGDDNGNSKLDYNETWRYSCNARLSKTTESIATATGFTNNITAIHKAYATVIVGLNTPPPLISIVNVTKVAYPLSLPIEGGKIIYTYKVNNPGVVPLSRVTITDDKCSNMSGKLGDTNNNNLLDPQEVWIYTCTMILRQTTSNTAHVSAFANGLEAISDAAITVAVKNPNFPEVGVNPEANFNFKITVWRTLSIILAALIIFFFLTRKTQHKSFRKKQK